MTPLLAPFVRVAARRGQQALVAARRFVPGQTILVAQGVHQAEPSRTSVQIGPHLHLDVPDGAGPHAHPWRYLNHACRPNAAFLGRRLVAVSPIASGEEVTFDYETTEWELAVPFACACGSMGCTGREIRGFRHLEPEERMRRLPHLRDELRRLVETDPAATPAAS